eukprot:TRINITY_DN15762_c0_g1_i1.p1 TRINITY_DN15762_c0_g1~~TRINITY_DN15762_c0_g1_i1.p1  ORF type:complete len:791 (-),score=142.30 TRINITY_DN15762_c0_g1_i1:88-2460(-)
MAVVAVAARRKTALRHVQWRHISPCLRDSSRRHVATHKWDRVPSRVLLTDVSPRDGLQNESRLVDTATKLELIRRLRRAGLRSVEATSFVNPKLVPQMADAAEVIRGCVEPSASDGFLTASDVAYPVLVPNLRGFETAALAGAREITVLASASDTFAQKNTKCTVEENLERAGAILKAAEQKGIRSRGAVAACLGCPFEGAVAPGSVIKVVSRLLELGCEEVAICDTIGVATPASMAGLLGEMLSAGIPVDKIAVHLHDTYGQATANLLVALQHGVHRADAAAGGLGGCPFAGPGASGNAAMEDVVYLLNGLGVETGVDIDSLAETGEWICHDVLNKVNGSKAGGALRRQAIASASRKANNATSSASSSTSDDKTAAAPEDVQMQKRLPLAGIRVVEVGPGLIAGGWTGATLAYFGADVIKVEPPTAGDGIRKWRHLDQPGGDSLWWQSIARNKQSIALDLRKEEGRTLLRRLAQCADVLVENFKPGTLEKWNLAPSDLRKGNPRLVVARVSGYGQTGPKSSLPGFASVCEGVGGFRYVNGFPGEPPVRPNLSIGDTLAAMNATVGILLALAARSRPCSMTGGRGQDVDVSIVESVFGLLESCVPEYDRLGTVREPSGSTLTGIVPSGTYPCQGGAHVIIGANGDSLFKRLMVAIGREDLASDERFADNAGRVEHQGLLDAAIAEWSSKHTVEEAQAACDAAQVPCGPIYSIRDIFADPHFEARGCFESVTTRDGQPLRVPAVGPKLSETPGRTLRGGPTIGEHTDEVLRRVLNMPAAEIKSLRDSGIVA